MFSWYRCLQKVQSACFQLLLCLVGDERIPHPLILLTKINTAEEEVLNKNNFEPHTSGCQNLEMDTRWPYSSCKIEQIHPTGNCIRKTFHMPSSRGSNSFNSQHFNVKSTHTIPGKYKWIFQASFNFLWTGI